MGKKSNNEMKSKPKTKKSKENDSNDESEETLQFNVKSKSKPTKKDREQSIKKNRDFKYLDF